MELLKFKFSPNAYNLNIFVEEEGICSACNEKRHLKYNSSIYSIEEPEYTILLIKTPGFVIFYCHS